MRIELAPTISRVKKFWTTKEFDTVWISRRDNSHYTFATTYGDIISFVSGSVMMGISERRQSYAGMAIGAVIATYGLARPYIEKGVEIFKQSPQFKLGISKHVASNPRLVSVLDAFPGLSRQLIETPVAVGTNGVRH